MFKKLSLLWLFVAPTLAAESSKVSEVADNTAHYAVSTYQQAMIDSLAKLVSFNTVAVDNVPSTENPVHQAFKAELKRQATNLGLDYNDQGYLVIIGLGDSKERLGIITHGDVQPVDASKWVKSPFELDSSTEPGKLIARGTEDDKGPISTAMYAMKAIKDKNLPLNRRIELYVYMAEESDWQPLQDYVAKHEMPSLNITIDASYPVVTAEKGYGSIKLAFEHKSSPEQGVQYVASVSGGYFGSQIPEDASVVIEHINEADFVLIKKRTESYAGVNFDLRYQHRQLTIKARGKSAHSSTPEDGVNAITYIADLLAHKRWPNNGAGSLINFINDNIGLGLYGKKFGDIAYSDDFMGAMTVSPTVIKNTENNVELNINIRRPRGKSAEQLKQEIQQAVAHWNKHNNNSAVEQNHYIGEPFVQTDAPHINTLLAVFSTYTGIKDAKPVSIGGGTNSRLFPNAVSFGPSMPDAVYTGHTEREFITVEQFVLNLKMYTAALVELTR